MDCNLTKVGILFNHCRFVLEKSVMISYPVDDLLCIPQIIDALYCILLHISLERLRFYVPVFKHMFSKPDIYMLTI